MTSASQAPREKLNAGPLAGVKVIDMTSLVSGPFCGQILADLGAEVIKIESAGSDMMRYTGPSLHGNTAGFEQHNRGKKSLELDVKSEKGLATIKALVQSADIFLQNSRPGVMERLGLSYEALSQENPGLIYLSITGFGEYGPYADNPAYDMVIQGLVGFMPHQGGSNGPQSILSPVADKITAIWASNAALAALFHRKNTNEGQKIVVSMLTAYAAFILPDLMAKHTYVDSPSDAKAALGPYKTLPTSDGQVIGLIMARHHFLRLCDALERPDLKEDERFATGALLIENAEILYAEISAKTSSLTTDEFLQLAQQASLPFSRVNSVEGFLADPQAKISGAVVDFNDEEFGRIRHLGFPASFSKSPVDVSRRAPKLGEHTKAIIESLET